MTLRRLALAALALLWAGGGVPLCIEGAHANSTTANLGLNKPAVGADSDLWGGYLNGNADAIDAEFATTAQGDANYTVLSTDRNVVLTAAFTASRTFTLPAASALKASQAIRIIDRAGALSASNPLLIARAGADTVNGGTSLTVKGAYSVVTLRSDGASAWTATVSGKYDAANVAITGGSVTGLSSPTGVVVFSTAGANVGPGLTRFVGPASAETVDGASTIMIPFSGTVGDLSAQVPGTPGGSETFVYTLMKNLSPTALTCTIAGGTIQTCSDHADTVAVAAGDRIDVRLVTSVAANARSHVVAISLRP